MNGIGIVFNIDDLGGFYGNEAWHIFMRNIKPSTITGCILKHGDTMQTLNGNQREFCIAVFGNTLEMSVIRLAFEKCTEKGLAPLNRRFISNPSAEPLMDYGSIDTKGRLVQDEWSRITHDQCKDCGWGFAPKSVTVDLSPDLQSELENMRNNMSSQANTVKEDISQSENNSSLGDTLDKTTILNNYPQNPSEDTTPTTPTNTFSPWVPTIPKKKKNGCLIAVLICVGLVVIVILASAISKSISDVYDEISSANATTASVESSLELLKDESATDTVRKNAALALAESGDSTAIQELIVFLKTEDNDYTLRCSIALALHLIDNNPIKTPFGLVCQSDEYYFSINLEDSIRSALSESAEDVVGTLINILKNKSEDQIVQGYIAHELGNIVQFPGDTRIRALDILISISQDVSLSDELRINATYSLGCIGGDRAVAQLLQLLSEKKISSDLKGQAVSALDRTDDERAIEPLKNIMQNNKENIEVRRNAAVGLVGYRMLDMETMLLSAFNQFGDLSMAKAYINSGNDHLETAATNWAHANGYTIYPIYEYPTGDASNSTEVTTNGSWN